MMMMISTYLFSKFGKSTSACNWISLSKPISMDMTFPFPFCMNSFCNVSGSERNFVKLIEFWKEILLDKRFINNYFGKSSQAQILLQIVDCLTSLAKHRTNEHSRAKVPKNTGS